MHLSSYTVDQVTVLLRVDLRVEQGGFIHHVELNIEAFQYVKKAGYIVYWRRAIFPAPW